MYYSGSQIEFSGGPEGLRFVTQNIYLCSGGLPEYLCVQQKVLWTEWERQKGLPFIAFTCTLVI